MREQESHLRSKVNTIRTMMFFTKDRNRESEGHGWIPINESAWEKTSTAALITSGLTYLQKRRKTLVLTCKGYQSAATMLVDHGPSWLVLGMPADLPAKSAAFRVHFKDQANLGAYFDVQVLDRKEDLLYTSAPRQLMRLQRRAHYRVETPDASRASFVCQGELNDSLAVKDLSIGGMLCCSRKKLAEGSPLKDISLTLPCCSGPSQNVEVIIPQGRVIRSSVDQETRMACHGVVFECGRKEESALLRYIRQREIELARVAAAER